MSIRPIRFLIVPVVATAFFLGGRFLAHDRGAATVAVLPDRTTQRVFDGRREELTIILVASGSCPACADPLLPATVETAKTAVENEARRRGLAFGSIGVGVDPSPAEGLAELDRFGTFSEVSTGRSWQGLGVFQFIWQAFPGEASVPQLLVVERAIIGSGDRLLIDRGSLVARKVGLSEINAWARAGFPLPVLTPVPDS